MKNILGWKLLPLALLTLFLAPPAHAASDEQNLVDRARITLDDVKKDKEFGNTLQLLKRAKAVLIVPGLIKGGFFVGGEGGTGVLLSREATGTWSSPAFYTMAAASFGLQIGGEESRLVLILLTDKAKKAFMTDEFKLGAQAGLTVVTLGSSAEAATTSNLKADIVVWASSTGAYAGLTLDGSVIKPRASYNAEYYGHTVSPASIFAGHEYNAKADNLRMTLQAEAS
jgi:lipid-binding SYLF domain-containing protein